MSTGSDENDRTVVRSTPAGGRRPQPAPSPPPRAQPPAAPPPDYGARPRSVPAPAGSQPGINEFLRQGINPLVQAATPLLVLAAQLRNLVQPPDLEQMQQRAVAEIRTFEERAKGLGCANEAVVTARYLLCTFLDESVMSTPWGEQSGWRQRSLLVIFHRETWGGEKFFQILERADPGRHLDLLELIYVILSLGFAGKYHVEERGRERLDEVTRSLYNRIATQRGRPEPELSLRWRGVEDTRNPVFRFVPLWVVAVAAVSIVIVAFVWCYIALGRRASPIETQLASVGLEGVNMVTTEPPPPPPKHLSLKELLAPDEGAGVLTVEETPDRSLVTVSGAVFASGSTRIEEQYLQRLSHIGEALEKVPGRVLVIGHTDDQPLRSLRFRDNFELSRERALEFTHVIGAHMSRPNRLEWSGVGSTSPRCSPPSTPENRACNRRVEIVYLPGS